ncbi:MAG: DUF3604 domain-containing protein [Spirochaetaceae bacterium]|nr:MAG: DUF3604 domain-containing protein [Spirochaetaceae bacterium]
MAQERVDKKTTELGQNYQLYWGDIHNHNAVGYARGSLERSIDVAREHLDYFAFTGHASWHDMPQMPGDRHMKWVHGFKAHSDHWPRTRTLIEEANGSGFVAFLGYEWHSSTYGDFCLVFPQDQPDLYLPDDAAELFRFARHKRAFAIPHHVAYKQGWRGANWSVFDPSVAPVVEIFSEHGCTESDRAPYPMILHSNGGRSYSNTVEYQLKRGLRFGFVASTDDHFGYPGAYGEGVAAAWATDLSRAAIFDAIRNRRTYAVTGDRIRLEFVLNREPMGSELPATAVRLAEIAVEGEDSVHMIELIKNGAVIRRHFPEDGAADRGRPFSEAKCRIQYGWGPWAALDLARTCSWDMAVRVENGRFLKAERCFQSGPYEEDLRDRLTWVSDRELRLVSFTSRADAYLQDPTKSVVLTIAGDAATRLVVSMTRPHALERRLSLAELVEDNDLSFTSVFTSESLMIHRLVFPDEYRAHVQWEDQATGQPNADWYYVRVRQHNGHLAWSSPIWVG